MSWKKRSEARAKWRAENLSAYGRSIPDPMARWQSRWHWRWRGVRYRIAQLIYPEMTDE